MENWFKPIDKVTLSVEADGKTTSQVKNKYRTASRMRDIPGEGRGQRQIIPTDGPIPMSQDIRMQEFKDQQVTGYPTKKIFLKPDELKDACKKWFIMIAPKEKETSDFNKAMFRQKIADAMQLMQFGSQINPTELEDEFSRVWDDTSNKLFIKKAGGPMPLQPGGGADGAMGGRPNTPGVPVPNNVAPAVKLPGQ